MIFHGLVIVKSVSESYPDHFGPDECDSEPRLGRSGAIRVQTTILEQFGVHRFCDLKSQQTWQIWEQLKSMKIQYFDENPGFLVKSVFF